MNSTPESERAQAIEFMWATRQNLIEASWRLNQLAAAAETAPGLLADGQGFRHARDHALAAIALIEVSLSKELAR